MAENAGDRQGIDAETMWQSPEGGHPLTYRTHTTNPFASPWPAHRERVRAPPPTHPLAHLSDSSLITGSLARLPPAPAPLPLSPELTKLTSPWTLHGPSHLPRDPRPWTAPRPQRSLMPALPKRATSHPYPVPQSLPRQPLCLTSSLSGSGSVSSVLPYSFLHLQSDSQ